jgi:soluble lytic murein transglycosylase
MKNFNRVLVYLLLVCLVFLLIDSPILGRLLYPLQYEDLIVHYANRHKLDPSLVAAVIRVESNYRPQAVSRKGARGLMEVLPTTGKWILRMKGTPLSLDQVEEQLFVPEFNISLGTWYLAFLTRKFDGEKAKILAAYNAGQGQVSAWLEQDVWDGTFENRDQIPFAETRDYLGKVKKAQIRYRRFYNLP